MHERRRPATLRLPKMDGATRDVSSGCAANGIDEEEADDDEDEDDPVSMVSFACADCATIWPPPDEDDDEEEADGAGIDALDECFESRCNDLPLARTADEDEDEDELIGGSDSAMADGSSAGS